ncbi:hypothetical protein BDN70DRAFT_847029 [Pholiota conissans]|uniref:Uncharacterized protein n=1 Tax=Pholiota conissans TaxID=109636 RepID=A0A9P5ZFF0_9AGAR|nr:hypothetical protein BDN70DRAFT_847029 [Pholiota conissans]
MNSNSGKRRKFSGLSGAELQIAHDALVRLKQTFIMEESDDQTDPSDESTGPTFDVQIDEMITMMENKLHENSQVFAEFLQYDHGTLEAFNITQAGILLLKPYSKERLTSSRSLGENSFWSSKNFNLQLELLKNLIPRTNEACARVWIDTFFFRASAMLPPAQRMVLNLEQEIPATTVKPLGRTTLSGFVDYTVVVTNRVAAATLFQIPTLTTIKMLSCSGFFVIEAKINDPGKHIAQAVCEIYTCGKYLGKQILRGTLTNGSDWIFIIVRINADSNGASFSYSSPISSSAGIIHPDGNVLKLGNDWSDIVAGILYHWINNSFSDIDHDDWIKEVTVI